MMVDLIAAGAALTAKPPGIPVSKEDPELTRERVLHWLNWSKPLRTQWGSDRSTFGHADYWASLMNLRDEEKDSPQEALKTQRNRVLAWLTGEGKDTLAEGHGPGEEGGLYERIKGDPLSTIFGDKSQPGRGDWFGQSDLSHALASGKSRSDILSWIQDQGATNVLRGGNLPGVEGGIYEWLADAATGGGGDGGSSGSIPVTRDDKNYPTLGGGSVELDDRTSLKIRPRDTMLPKRTTSLSSPKRNKYEQTTDLARQARNSLNIS